VRRLYEVPRRDLEGSSAGAALSHQDPLGKISERARSCLGAPAPIGGRAGAALLPAKGHDRGRRGQVNRDLGRSPTKKTMPAKLRQCNLYLIQGELQN
jgi:hypothetical protein